MRGLLLFSGSIIRIRRYDSISRDRQVASDMHAESIVSLSPLGDWVMKMRPHEGLGRVRPPLAAPRGSVAEQRRRGLGGRSCPVAFAD